MRIVMTHHQRKIYGLLFSNKGRDKFTHTSTHTHTHAKDTLHIQTHSSGPNLVNEINPTSFLNEHYYPNIILIAEASKVNIIYVLSTFNLLEFG